MLDERAARLEADMASLREAKAAVNQRLRDVREAARTAAEDPENPVPPPAPRGGWLTIRCADSNTNNNNGSNGNGGNGNVLSNINVNTYYPGGSGGGNIGSGNIRRSSSSISKPHNTNFPTSPPSASTAAAAAALISSIAIFDGSSPPRQQQQQVGPYTCSLLSLTSSRLSRNLRKLPHVIIQRW